MTHQVKAKAFVDAGGDGDLAFFAGASTRTSNGILAVALDSHLYNLGTIWFVQIVVYPLFAKVGADDYASHHRYYASRIPLPVILPGFLSFFLPMAVFAFLPDGVPAWLAAANIAMGLIGLAVTVGLEMPRHGKMERGGRNDKLIAE